jgi:hypothetical protein
MLDWVVDDWYDGMMKWVMMPMRVSQPKGSHDGKQGYTHLKFGLF